MRRNGIDLMSQGIETFETVPSLGGTILLYINGFYVGLVLNRPRAAFEFHLDPHNDCNTGEAQS